MYYTVSLETEETHTSGQILAVVNYDLWRSHKSRSERLHMSGLQVNPRQRTLLPVGVPQEVVLRIQRVNVRRSNVGQKFHVRACGKIKVSTCRNCVTAGILVNLLSPDFLRASTLWPDIGSHNEPSKHDTSVFRIQEVNGVLFDCAIENSCLEYL